MIEEKIRKIGQTAMSLALDELMENTLNENKFVQTEPPSDSKENGKILSILNDEFSYPGFIESVCMSKTYSLKRINLTFILDSEAVWLLVTNKIESVYVVEPIFKKKSFKEIISEFFFEILRRD